MPPSRVPNRRRLSRARRLTPGRRTVSRRRTRGRRGALTLALVLVLAVVIAAAALVLNYGYLVLAQRQLQHRADLLALAGAPALLHPGLLTTGGAAKARQSAAVTAALDEVDAFRAANNAHLPPRWQVTNPEIHAEALRATLGDAGLAAQPLGRPSAAAPANCLRLEIERGRAGGWNWLLGNELVGRSPPPLTVAATALLDDQVAGFRPRADLAAPVMPLAIDLAAWRNGRRGDANRNGIRELEVILPLATRAGVTPSGGNTVVLGYAGTVDPAAAVAQVIGGLWPHDLPNTGGALGPLGPQSPSLVRGHASLPTSQAAALQAALNELTRTGDAGRRVWPLYDAERSTGGRYALCGFVAGRVLTSQMAGGRLRITLEPCFLIHATAWCLPGTVPLAQPALVYRLCLAR